MNQKTSENMTTIYYAHPMELYNTAEEQNALKLIRKRFLNSKIINPKEYDDDPKLSKQKKGHVAGDISTVGGGSILTPVPQCLLSTWSILGMYA